MKGQQKCQSLLAIAWSSRSGVRYVVVCPPATAFQGEEGWISLSTSSRAQLLQQGKGICAFSMEATSESLSLVSTAQRFP